MKPTSSWPAIMPRRWMGWGRSITPRRISTISRRCTGSTYPDFPAGLGSRSSRPARVAWWQDTDNGPLEFRFTIRNQTAVGLATIRGAVEQRDYLRNLQRDFFRSAVEQGRRHRHAAFVFGDPANTGLTTQTLELLQRHHIQVNRLASAVTIDGRTFQPTAPMSSPRLNPSSAWCIRSSNRRRGERQRLWQHVLRDRGRLWSGGRSRSAGRRNLANRSRPSRTMPGA